MDRIREFIPEELSRFTDIFYTKDELLLCEILLDGPLAEDEISAAMGKDCAEIVREAYKKQILSKVMDDDLLKYRMNKINSVMNTVAVFDRPKWESMPLEDQQFLAKWMYDSFFETKKAMSLEEKKANKNCVLPLKQAEEYLHEMYEKTGMITIIPCDCHCKYGSQGYDWNTCINFGKGINSNPDRGLGRIVSEEEALEILHKADDVGLIHSGEAEVICNCNSKYCYPMLASMQLDIVHQWPVTDYVIDFDESKCLKCGLCTKRCQFGVFKLENKVLTLDKSKCWGCGICETKCPGKALKTVKICK